MKHIAKEMILTAALIIAGGLIVSGFFLTEEARTETYIDDALFFQETSEERICTDEQSGISFAQGEILVSFEGEMDKRAAEAIAEKNGAKLVGLIESTGNCQWQFEGDYTLAELKEKAAKLEEQDGVTMAMVNYVTEIGTNGMVEETETGDPTPSGMNYEAENLIGAISARASFWNWIKTHKVTPADVGIIDSYFETEHNDLYFEETFFNPDSDWMEKRMSDKSLSSHELGQLQHGTHVAGIIGAVCYNDRGLDGMYPLGSSETITIRASHLYGVSLFNLSRQGERRRMNSFSEEAALELLFRNGVKLINYSIGYGGDMYRSDQKWGSGRSSLRYGGNRELHGELSAEVPGKGERISDCVFCWKQLPGNRQFS